MPANKLEPFISVPYAVANFHTVDCGEKPVINITQIHSVCCKHKRRAHQTQSIRGVTKTVIFKKIEQT